MTGTGTHAIASEAPPGERTQCSACAAGGTASLGELPQSKLKSYQVPGHTRQIGPDGGVGSRAALPAAGRRSSSITRGTLSGQSRS